MMIMILIMSIITTLSIMTRSISSNTSNDPISNNMYIVSIYIIHIWLGISKMLYSYNNNITIYQILYIYMYELVLPILIVYNTIINIGIIVNIIINVIIYYHISIIIIYVIINYILMRINASSCKPTVLIFSIYFNNIYNISISIIPNLILLFIFNSIISISIILTISNISLIIAYSISFSIYMKYYIVIGEAQNNISITIYNNISKGIFTYSPSEITTNILSIRLGYRFINTNKMNKITPATNSTLIIRYIIYSISKLNIRYIIILICMKIRYRIIINSKMISHPVSNIWLHVDYKIAINSMIV
jgi:hypothetical protein